MPSLSQYETIKQLLEENLTYILRTKWEENYYIGTKGEILAIANRKQSEFTSVFLDHNEEARMLNRVDGVFKITDKKMTTIPLADIIDKKLSRGMDNVYGLVLNVGGYTLKNNRSGVSLDYIQRKSLFDYDQITKMAIRALRSESASIFAQSCEKTIEDLDRLVGSMHQRATDAKRNTVTDLRFNVLNETQKLLDIASSVLLQLGIIDARNEGEYEYVAKLNLIRPDRMYKLSRENVSADSIQYERIRVMNKVREVHALIGEFNEKINQTLDAGRAAV